MEDSKKLKELEAKNKELQKKVQEQAKELPRIEILEGEIEELKKELTASKTSATKAKNALTQKSKEVVELNEELKLLEEQQAELLANYATQIESLKAKLKAGSGNELEFEKLQEKALKVMQQRKIESCFIALTGHVFISEGVAEEYCKKHKTSYRIAKIVNGEEIQLVAP